MKTTSMPFLIKLFSRTELLLFGLPLFCTLVLASSFSFAKSAKDKTVCTAKDLTSRSCYMTLSENRIHIWNDKIFLNDLRERDVQSIAQIDQDKSQVHEWQFAKARQLSSRWFIEMGLWGPPRSDGQVESLWWVVFEIKNGQLIKHFEKLIQKRKRLQGEAIKYDKIAKFDLVEKKKQVVWSVNKDSGSL